MNTISMELHQEQITELQSQFEESESKNHCLEEELEDLKAEYEELEEVCQDLKKENNSLKREKNSLMKANATVLNFYREDCGKMEGLQELNNKLVKSCKKANRDFFILAAAYVATLMLMIYLFIR
jgi:predicted nuclease with TOPRIM domain